MDGYLDDCFSGREKERREGRGIYLYWLGTKRMDYIEEKETESFGSEVDRE